jgi:hypothetical protein
MAPKWGDEAVKNMWKRRQNRKLVATLVSLMFIIAVLNPKQLGAWIIVAVGTCVCVWIGTRNAKYGRKMYEAASDSLGIEVTRLNGQSPPTRLPAYEQWCDANDLAPYQASVRFRK